MLEGNYVHTNSDRLDNAGVQSEPVRVNLVPVAFEKYWDIASRYEVMKLPEVIQAINVHVLENRGKFFQDVTVVSGNTTY